MASVESGSVSLPSDPVSADGPVLGLIGKRLRALRKKYNRIIQMEERLAQGKTLNKEQEEVLRSKPSVALLIDEYEKLRTPLAAAVQEELSLLAPPALPQESASAVPSAVPSAPVAECGDNDKAVHDLVTLLYFSLLFDVKQEGEFKDVMVMRNHERDRCLTYDYVTDDATDLLGHDDLDAISHLGASITSRVPDSGASHRTALQDCVQHAKLWLQNADQPIQPGASVTYAGLREKMNKILASDYCTTISGMKSAADVAAAVYACQVEISEINDVPPAAILVEGAVVTANTEEKENKQEGIHEAQVQTEAVYEPSKVELQDEPEVIDSLGDDISAKEQENLEKDAEEDNLKEVERKNQNYPSRRSYQNFRGGNRGGGSNGGGRRGYVTGRGGRGGRGGNGVYQNGRNQYYDPGYYPRNNYSGRSRGSRSGSSGMYTGHDGGPHGGHAPANVELETTA